MSLAEVYANVSTLRADTARANIVLGCVVGSVLMTNIVIIMIMRKMKREPRSYIDIPYPKLMELAPKGISVVMVGLALTMLVSFMRR